MELVSVVIWGRETPTNQKVKVVINYSMNDESLIGSDLTPLWVSMIAKMEP